MKEYEFCLRCGRKLKKPEVRVIGYGPVCQRKMAIESAGVKPLFSDGVRQSNEKLPRQ